MTETVWQQHNVLGTGTNQKPVLSDIYFSFLEGNVSFHAIPNSHVVRSKRNWITSFLAPMLLPSAKMLQLKSELCFKGNPRCTTGQNLHSFQYTNFYQEGFFKLIDKLFKMQRMQLITNFAVITWRIEKGLYYVPLTYMYCALYFPANNKACI